MAGACLPACGLEGGVSVPGRPDSALLPLLGASASRHRVLRARRPGQQELVSAGSLLGGMELRSPARCVCHACWGLGRSRRCRSGPCCGSRGRGDGRLQVGGASGNVSSQEAGGPPSHPFRGRGKPIPGRIKAAFPRRRSRGLRAPPSLGDCRDRETSRGELPPLLLSLPVAAARP